MLKNKKIIIFLYNRFFDPLIQANFWLYIDDYLKDPASGIKFHLITYEDERFPLTTHQHALAERWQSQGLGWTKLSWHPGTELPKKFVDLWHGGMAVLKLRLRGFKNIISYGSISSAFAYLYGTLLGCRLFIHTFEPHSEYATDSGMWSRSSLTFKSLNYLERRAACFAVSVASGTLFMENRLKSDWKIKGKFFKIPSVADDKKFLYSQSLREITRKELNLPPGQPVIFYPGKFGGLYYRMETALMYRWFLDLEPRLHFLVVTPNAAEEVHGIFADAGVPKNTYTIIHSSYSDIHRYFFAADFAVVAVPPGPSRKFVSNIKVGEYLCAGLPYLICKGVSEDYLVATEKDVGVVVDDFGEYNIKSQWPAVKRFLEMDPDFRRRHCRDVGLAYRGFDSLNPVFKSAMNHLLSSLN